MGAASAQEAKGHQINVNVSQNKIKSGIQSRCKIGQKEKDILTNPVKFHNNQENTLNDLRGKKNKTMTKHPKW